MDNIETLESKYPWVKFYRELAHKLLEYKDNKKDFADKFNATGVLELEIGDWWNPISMLQLFICHNKYQIRNKEVSLVDLANIFKSILSMQAETPSIQELELLDMISTRLDLWNDESRMREFSTPLWQYCESIIDKDHIEGKDFAVFKTNGIGFTLYDVSFLIRPDLYLPASETSRWLSNGRSLPKFSKSKIETYKGYIRFLEDVDTKIKNEGWKEPNYIEIVLNALKTPKNKKNLNKDSLYNNEKNSAMIDNIIKILESNKNIILQGAPGCGKTYITTDVAVKLCDGELPTDITSKERYKELVDKGRIGFTTFHQSMDYEEFVEGLKPEETDDGQMKFVVKPGIFKRICTEATKDDNKKKNFVLIIDEINRANISKVLGELITLLESSKRLGEDDEFKVTLPYSGETFGVPRKLYIIGTMNTADRSVGYIDYAIRRRFAFYTLKANEDAIIKFYEDNKEKVEDLHEKEKTLFEAVKKIVDKNLAQDFNVDDLMVGHSYFMAKNEEEFDFNLEYKIKPLLKEYVRDGILIVDSVKDSIDKLPANSDTSKEK